MRLTTGVIKDIISDAASWCAIYSLFTPRKPHPPLILNGERGFLGVNRLEHDLIDQAIAQLSAGLDALVALSAVWHARSP